MTDPAYEEVDLHTPGTGSPWWANANGDVVHRAGCHRIGAHSGPWLSARDYTEAEVRARARATPWLRLCRVCLPATDGPEGS